MGEKDKRDRRVSVVECSIFETSVLKISSDLEYIWLCILLEKVKYERKNPYRTKCFSVEFL